MNHKTRNHNPEHFIQASDSKLLRPLSCVIGGCKIDYCEGDTVYVTGQIRPCCENHKSYAAYEATVCSCSGSPWDGENIEKGLCDYFDSAQWFDIIDLEPCDP